MATHYLADVEFVENQVRYLCCSSQLRSHVYVKTSELQASICEAHKSHTGMTEWDAESKFLDIASHQELYGVALHFSKDDQGRVVKIGIGAGGISVYRMNDRIFNFPWSIIVNVEYSRKKFVVKYKADGEVRAVKFELQSVSSCQVALGFPILRLRLLIWCLAGSLVVHGGISLVLPS